MTTLLLLALTAPSTALAGDMSCAALCHDLDAVEESCEDSYGDGHDLCESIGAVEETCDPEDGGTTETCPTLCEDIDALDDACDGTYGASDPVCQGLDALAEDCEDGSEDGGGGDADATAKTVIPMACATGAVRSGWLGVLGAGLAAALHRRRR